MSDQEKLTKDVMARKAAGVVSNFLNVYGHDKEAFIEAMTRDHRTLQQLFTGLCFAWIEKCASMEKEERFDLRNQYSVTKCKEIMEKVELMQPPFI